MDNKDLKQTYDKMHKQGVSSWFSDGREERETIIRIGEPWEGLRVLEIGCGEGELSAAIKDKGAAWVTGNDYSDGCLEKALEMYGEKVQFLMPAHYKEIYRKGYHVLVMQGVLEHLDDPFAELQWMINHFKPKTVITSSPCFLNPRGIVWMTLDMVGAVMSKTDLHFLHPWQFTDFCDRHGYKLGCRSCDDDWGNYEAMVEDLSQRIPLALKDGGLKTDKLEPFLRYLTHFPAYGSGATMVYRIDV